MRLLPVALFLTFTASPAEQKPPASCVSGMCFSQLHWVVTGKVEGVLENNTATRLLMVGLEFDAYSGETRTGGSADENAVIPTYSSWQFEVPAPPGATGMQPVRLTWYESSGRQELDLATLPRVCRPGVKAC